MAVPKKRTGKSAQATRRANWKATKPEVNVCPNCGAFVLAHTVCTNCGFYKGKPVSIKDAKNAEPVKEVKTAKKVAKKEVEAPVTETPVVEAKTEKKPAAKKSTTKKTTKSADEKKPAAKKATTAKKTTKKATKKTEE